MRILRGIAIAIGLILVALSIGVIVFADPIKQMLKRRIETRLGYIFKSDVTVGTLEVMPLQRGAVITDLVVSNPAGFRHEAALHFRHIRFSFDLSTLFSPMPVLENVVLQETEVFLRHEAGRGTNLVILGRNAKSAADSDAGSERPSRKILLRELVSTGGTVHLSTNLVPVAQVPIRLAAFTLEDIGSEKPVSTAGMAAIFVRSLLVEVITLKGILRPLSNGLREEMDRLVVP